jgi:predicted TIM-barrel fold metal-dependent hydrolase
MSGQAGTLSPYPSDGIAPPTERSGRQDPTLELPAGTEVFSADNHISLAEDIWYERFPERLKDRAPRVWFENGIYNVGTEGASFLPPAFTDPLAQFEGRPGASTANLEARLADLDAEDVAKELAFPNGVLVLFGYPDKEVREYCFRVYNEYMAELQERSNGRFYGVGLVNYWDGEGARRTINEAKELGLKTYLLPLNPGTDNDGNPIDWASRAQDPVWEAVEEAGLPVSHHIGEFPLSSEYNSTTIGFLHNVATFREMFGKYIFGGVLDRHQGVRVGWFEGGVNWVVSAIQDAEHADHSYRHMHNWDVQHDVKWYWENHMSASFMVDPLGMELIDRIGVDRVMWSSDYPHNESTFGYSKQSLDTVVKAVGKETAGKVVGGNIKEFLGV